MAGFVVLDSWQMRARLRRYRGGATTRRQVQVDGHPASYLTAGDGRVVLLLHGAYWSRAWEPILEPMAARGLRPVAVDLPGCGHSGGRLDRHAATVPALAAWVERFADALGLDAPLLVAGHDIGGAIAQHLAVRGRREVARLALVDSVSHDSWPDRGARGFRDVLETAIGRPMTDEELAGYLAPWWHARVADSWRALVDAADARYTLDLVDDLRRSPIPKLLVWGEDDPFQPLAYAERLLEEMPFTELVRVAGAGHIPMETAPDLVAAALADFFGGA